MSEIRAEVAGSIWKIERRVGDEVQAGEAILIIEAMKMEIPVEAPVAGKIIEICVAEGETIEEGRLVVRLESG